MPLKFLEKEETNKFRTNVVQSCTIISLFMDLSCFPRYKPLITGSFLIFLFYSHHLEKVLCFTNKSYLIVCSVLEYIYDNDINTPNLVLASTIHEG